MSNTEDQLFLDLSQALIGYLDEINPDHGVSLLHAKNIAEILITHAQEHLTEGRQLARFDTDDNDRPFVESILSLPPNAKPQETRSSILRWMTHALENGFQIGSVDQKKNTATAFSFEVRRR